MSTGLNRLLKKIENRTFFALAGRAKMPAAPARMRGRVGGGRSGEQRGPAIEHEAVPSFRWGKNHRGDELIRPNLFAGSSRAARSQGLAGTAGTVKLTSLE